MSSPIFFRRCHVCGATNQSLMERVEECECCGRTLPPFFYFDERIVPVAQECHLRPVPQNYQGYAPIQGLTAYWE